MRRDALEIGLEREYALYASTGATLAYLLAADRLLALVDEPVPPGWRLAPEYAHCLVEIASPPVTREGWPALLAGFARLEAALAAAATALAAQSRFDHVACTAAYSVRTDRFVAWDGSEVTTYPALLLDGAHANWLRGAPDAVPACFAGSRPELLYAGFTSTNATIHPAERDYDEAAYYARLLRAARQIETASPQRHAFLRGGRTPIAPDPELSIRDALVRWGDPATAAILDGGAPDFAAACAPAFHAYSCRSRLVDDTRLYELRCFHAGLPLANLAPLLDIPAFDATLRGHPRRGTP